MIDSTDIASLLASDQPRAQMFADYHAGRSPGIPNYDLEQTDLSAFACLVITNAADQRYLHQHRAQLEAYLDQGGKIAFSGHVAYPFLGMLSRYVPTPEHGLAGLQVHCLGKHPIWAGVEGGDLTFRKGVAGFYGRGYNPPPAGAVVLNELGTQARLPLDWEYTTPEGGVLLVHAGNDFLSFANAPSAQGMRKAFYQWAVSHATQEHHVC